MADEKTYEDPATGVWNADRVARARLELDQIEEKLKPVVDPNDAAAKEAKRLARLTAGEFAAEKRKYGFG